jgi:hypothetical protein
VQSIRTPSVKKKLNMKIATTSFAVLISSLLLTSSLAFAAETPASEALSAALAKNPKTAACTGTLETHGSMARDFITLTCFDNRQKRLFEVGEGFDYTSDAVAEWAKVQLTLKMANPDLQATVNSKKVQSLVWTGPAKPAEPVENCKAPAGGTYCRKVSENEVMCNEQRFVLDERGISGTAH